jgi:hypothetical protein
LYGDGALRMVVISEFGSPQFALQYFDLFLLLPQGTADHVFNELLPQVARGLEVVVLQVCQIANHVVELLGQQTVGLIGRAVLFLVEGLEDGRHDVFALSESLVEGRDQRLRLPNLHN